IATVIRIVYGPPCTSDGVQYAADAWSLIRKCVHGHPFGVEYITTRVPVGGLNVMTALDDGSGPLSRTVTVYDMFAGPDGTASSVTLRSECGFAMTLIVALAVANDVGAATATLFTMLPLLAPAKTVTTI